METKMLAQIAYRAYGDWSGWKTMRDKQMPVWDELPMSQQNAWTAAISAVSAEMAREAATHLETVRLP